MQIIKNILVLFFLLLSYKALAGFVAIDANSMNETQWQGSQLKNSSITLTLPASALKEASDGRLVLNLPGGAGGWDNWKKPRPFFMGESLVQVNDEESLFGRVLKSIRQALESSMSREEIRQQQERLDALEMELEAYRRQQVAEALAQQFGAQGEGVFFFRSHPGYQENHPAHPAKEQVYTVPGILETPKSKGGASGGMPPSSTKSSTRSSPKSDGAGVSSGSAGKGGASANGGASGGGEKKPEGTRKEERKGENSDLYHVTKDLDDGTKLEAMVGDSLYCPLCIDLVNSSAVQCIGCSNGAGWHTECEGCETTFCKDHVDKLNECPCCRHLLEGNTYNVVAKGKELRNIKWACTDCGKEGTESEMEGHGLQCVKKSLVLCSHEGCEANVLRRNLREHEVSCDYRPVDFGCFQIPFWQKMLIESVEVPDGLERENAEAHPAEASVSILCGLILTLPPGEAVVDCAWGCGYQGQNQNELEEHYVNCPRVFEGCSYCGLRQERRCMSSHMSACDKRPVVCPLDCGIEGLVAWQLEEHSTTCEMRLVECEYCENEFAQKTLGDHESECEWAFEPARCSGCLSEITVRELTEHTKNCALMQARFQLGDLLLSRQPDTENAVYEPSDGSEDAVYLILLAEFILEAVRELKGDCYLGHQAIKFTWNKCRYYPQFSSYYGFSIKPVPNVEQECFTGAYIDILSDSSQLLGRMQTFFFKNDEICINHPSIEGKAVLYNAAGLEGYKGKYCAIRIRKIK